MKVRKVLLIDIGTSFGGVEVYLRDITELLEGHAEFRVFCVLSELRDALVSRVPGVICARRLSKWGKPVQLFAAAVTLVWLRALRKIDTVWINGYSEMALLPLARALGCAAIATRHLTFDIEPGPWHRNWRRYVARYVYRKLAFSADKVICVSHTVAESMRSALPRQTAISVIPNWVQNIPEVHRRQLCNSRLNLVFVGRLEKHKGASLLLEAMHRLKSDSPSTRVSLTVVGAGSEESSLRAMVRDLDVRFAGYQRNTSLFFREADVFVNPSLGPEGLPLVTLEAMSHGLPCILSDLPVHREITEDGWAAELFASGDSSDLAGKLREILNDHALLEKFGKRSQEAIEKRHTRSKAMQSYLAALESL